jgi:hypothetical protein
VGGWVGVWVGKRYTESRTIVESIQTAMFARAFLKPSPYFNIAGSLTHVTLPWKYHVSTAK